MVTSRSGLFRSNSSKGCMRDATRWSSHFSVLLESVAGIPDNAPPKPPKIRMKQPCTYLYFVCTNSPDINVLRVQQRTREGGHDVPEEKIRVRYERSLANLTQAISIAYRTYLFDNSGREASLLADVTPDRRLNLRKHTAPAWFHEHVLPLFS